MSGAPQLSVTPAQALAWRSGRHLLDPYDDAPRAGREADPAAGTVAGVVGRLGAVLSMDESLAELAVRTRREGSVAGELAAALADGSVIKAFAFRGSVHYLTPEDGGTYLALRTAGRQWELPSWVEHYRLTPDDWPDFRAAVREALTGGPLTVAELGAAVTAHRAYRHLRPVFDDGAGTLVKPLTWQGDMSIAPSRDGRLTFQRLDTNPRWAGVPDLDEAGPRAITDYLRSYGPATFEHVDHWLGGGLSAGRKRLVSWFAGLADRLASVDVAGTTAHVLREDLDALAASRPSDVVRFLPGHDQWVIGPGTKDTAVTPAALRQQVTRKANPVVVGGVVSGFWVRRRDDLTVAWAGAGPPPVAAFEREAARLGGLLGRDLALHVDEPA